MTKWIWQISALGAVLASGFLAAGLPAFADDSTATGPQPTVTIPGEPGVTQTVLEFVPGDTDTITRTDTDTITDVQRFTDTITDLNTATETITIEVEGPRGPRGFDGPRGPRGEKGDKGDTGEQGPPGTSSAECAAAGGSMQLVTVNAPGGQQMWLVCVIG